MFVCVCVCVSIYIICFTQLLQRYETKVIAIVYKHEAIFIIVLHKYCQQQYYTVSTTYRQYLNVYKYSGQTLSTPFYENYVNGGV